MDKENREKNREAWNEALVYHQKARNNSLHEGFKNRHFTTFDRDCDNLLIEKLNEIHLTDKVVAQLPCNNGRELLSLVKFGAKKGIGFDISDTAISEANELKAIANLNVEFYRTDIVVAASRRRGAHKSSGGRYTSKFPQNCLRTYTPRLRETARCMPYIAHYQYFL